MKTFTEDEKIIARNIDKGYKWIARDSNGNLGVYKGKTKKRGTTGTLMVMITFAVSTICFLLSNGRTKSLH